MVTTQRPIPPSLTDIAHDGTRWTALWKGTPVHTPPCSDEERGPLDFLVQVAIDVEDVIADGVPAYLEAGSVCCAIEDGGVFQMDMSYDASPEAQTFRMGRQGPRGWIFHLPHKTQPYVVTGDVYFALRAGLTAYDKATQADFFLVDLDTLSGVKGTSFQDGASFTTSQHTLVMTAPGKAVTGAKKFKSASDAMGYAKTLIGVRTIWQWVGVAPPWMAFDHAPMDLQRHQPTSLPHMLAVVERAPGAKDWTIAVSPERLRAELGRARRAWRVLNLYGHAARALADKVEGKAWPEDAVLRVYQAGSGVHGQPFRATADEMAALKTAAKMPKGTLQAIHASKSGSFFQVALLGSEQAHAALVRALEGRVGKANIAVLDVPPHDKLLDTEDNAWMPSAAEIDARFEARWDHLRR